ncbi:hypothetical protein DR64_8112 [Paraburkholderia xenovorans LB400]|nr:hypothetical protein DR64_8112 [Paraburkholderia xenovorans LB400]
MADQYWTTIAVTDPTASAFAEIAPGKVPGPLAT